MAPKEAKIVHERCEDSLHGPKHGAKAQVEQHQEKQCRPEWAGREKGHHLRECYECQACAFNTLHRKGLWDTIRSSSKSLQDYV